MKEKPYILVVDDDPNIAKLEQLYLEKAGYEVKTVGRGDDAMTEFRKMPPDLMLLDVMMPGMDGWQVLKAVRKSSNIPIIMVTARDETFDKVLGLELGADDYITKPFDSKEMAARVKAVLRRTMGQTEEEEEKADDTLSFPGLTVSLSRYEVFYEGKKLEMPPKELEVLYFLATSTSCSRAVSCLTKCGAFRWKSRAGRWMCTSSACGISSWAAKSTAGASRPSGGAGTSLRL